MKDMAEMETQLSGLVETTVVDTFHGMLGQHVTAMHDMSTGTEPAHKIHTRLMLRESKGNRTHENPNARLEEGAAAGADFCFSFDQDLLEKAASGFYPGDQLQNPQIFEDIACAISNIVGSRIKTWLNDNGYDLSMGLPFVEHEIGGDLPRQGTIHIHFAYDVTGGRHDDGLVVDVKVDSAAGKDRA